MMMKMKMIVPVMLLATLWGGVRAQSTVANKEKETSETLVLTLEQALEIALSENPTVKIADKTVEQNTQIIADKIRREFIKGQQLGYVMEDVDLDILILMIRDSFQAIKQYVDKNENIDSNGIHKSIRNLMLYILRGIATDKGRELINDYKKQYIDK